METVFLRDSPLRQLITQEARASSLDPFALTPVLKFDDVHEWSGREEFFETDQTLGSLSSQEGRALGEAIALWSFFGASDLHMENVLVGRKGFKAYVFPVDLEVILGDLALPSHTWLIPDLRIPLEVSGLAEVLPLPPPVALNSVSGYLDVLSLLYSIEGKIDEQLEDLHRQSRLRTRVIFRKTLSYQHFLDGQVVGREFEMAPFASEIEQLERKDIPYYFRFLDQPELFHFAQDMTPIRSDLNEHPRFKTVKLHDVREVRQERITKRIHGELLFKAGALQLTKALFVGAGNFSGADRDLKLDVTSEAIAITYQGKQFIAPRS